MAKQTYLDLTGLKKYDELLKGLIGEIPAEATEDNVIDYLEAQISDSEFSGNAADVSIADAGDKITATDVEGALQELAGAIATLNGTETGSVSKSISDALGELKIGETTYSTMKEYTDALAVGIKKIIANETGDISGLSTTNKSTIVAAINEVKSTADGAVTAIGVEAKAETAEGTGDAVEATGLYKYIDEAVAAVDSTTANAITIKTDSTSDGMLKSYTIFQGGEADANKIGVIDIPKDLVVSAGEVVVDPEGQTAGTYIKLTIANQETPLFINVKDLVDVYTAQASATQVQVAISEANEISATIVAKSITKTELADDLKSEIEAATTAIGVAKDGETAGTGLTGRMEVVEGLVGEGYESIAVSEITALFE